jgi:hypothetical protein
MNLAVNELTHRVRGLFKLDLLRDTLDAAVKSFDLESSPLRLKHFAFALRDLGRIWLEQLAPKEKIRACQWFEQNADLREDNGVTRAQRAKYAVQGEFHDEFVSEYLHIDVQSTVREYLALLDELSWYAHKSCDIPAKTAELEAIRALETFVQVSELIQERHDSLLSSAANAARKALPPTDELFGEFDEELDPLSRLFSGGEVHFESLSILSIDPERILYQGRGRVYARLRYGSDSGVAWDQGAAIHDIYPFECSLESNTGDPLWSIVRRSMKIDTSSVNDDGQG